MTQLSAANSYNVEASLNYWLTEQMAAYTLPDWLPQMPPLVFNAGDVTALIPCYAVFHLSGFTDERWQGGHVGGGLLGARDTSILEVSCYVSRAMQNWRPLQRLMRDYVKGITVAHRVVVIRDFLSDPLVGEATAYKVDISDVTEVETAPDPENDQIERARILIEYRFTFRSSSS